MNVQNFRYTYVKIKNQFKIENSTFGILIFEISAVLHLVWTRLALSV